MPRSFNSALGGELECEALPVFSKGYHLNHPVSRWTSAPEALKPR